MEKQDQITKTINSILSQDNIKKRFQEILGEKSAGFISSVLNIVRNNHDLMKAEPETILNAAVVAATLDLPIDPNLGFAAIVPYLDGKSGKTVAQFQMMYKGFIQLAQRSGQYRTINVGEIYEGELKSQNRITGDIEIDLTAKKSDKIVGYVAYFELINGFRKTWFWPVEKIDKHGKRYSKVYQKGKGLWTDKTNGGFEAMCQKTVLKMLLSKYGPLTIDYQTARAIKYDQAVIKDTDTEDIEYIDNVQEMIDEAKQEIPNPHGDLQEKTEAETGKLNLK